MSKKNTRFAITVICIVIITVLGAIIAGFGGLKNLTDEKTSSANTTENKKDIFPRSTQKKVQRPRGVAGKPYAQLLQEGERLLLLGEVENALALFQEAARISPKEWLPYEKVGDAFVLQSHYEKAAESYRFAFSLHSENRRLFIKQIRSLLNARKFTEAAKSLAQVQRKSPEIIYLNSLIASFYNEQQKARDAFTAIKKISDTEDNSDLTSLSILKNNVDVLENMYRDFELSKGAPLSYLQGLLAHAYNTIGEYGLSIETAFNALKIQNDYRDVWIVLGHSFLKVQRWFDAEDALSKALALDQKHPSAFFYRGLARMHLKKIREAMSDFSFAIDTGYKPRVDAILQLGDGWYVLGDTEKALQYYREVLSTDAHSLALFRKPIALVLLTEPNETAAVQLIDLAFKNHPSSAAVHAWKSIVRTRQGNLHEARILLEKAESLDVQEVYVLLANAELARAIGNAEAAKISYNKVLQTSSSDDDVLLQKYALIQLDEADNSFSLTLE